MSQTYKVRIKKTYRETARIGREWRQKIDMLLLLPADQMGNLLAIELEKDGWKKQSDGKLSSSRDQFELEFDPVTQQLKIVYEQEKAVELKVDRELNVYDVSDDSQRAWQKGESLIHDEANQELSKLVTDKSKELLSDLNASEDDLLNEIDEIFRSKVEKAHIEALKQKAKSLGEIQSVSENSEAGEVVIRVRV